MKFICEHSQSVREGKGDDIGVCDKFAITVHGDIQLFCIENAVNIDRHKDKPGNHQENKNKNVITMSEGFTEITCSCPQNAFSAILRHWRIRIFTFADFQTQQSKTDAVNNAHPKEKHRIVGFAFAEKPVIEDDSCCETDNAEKTVKAEASEGNIAFTLDASGTAETTKISWIAIRKN